MSNLGLPDDEVHRQVCLDNLVSGNAAHLSLGTGVTVRVLQAGNRAGLVLQVAHKTLQAGQLQRVLERRFAQHVAFDGCFVYLDAQDNLVIWHALPAQRSTLDRTLGRMLSLANLETLDTRASR